MEMLLMNPHSSKKLLLLLNLQTKLQLRPILSVKILPQQLIETNSNLFPKITKQGTFPPTSQLSDLMTTAIPPIHLLLFAFQNHQLVSLTLKLVSHQLVSLTLKKHLPHFQSVYRHLPPDLLQNTLATPFKIQETSKSLVPLIEFLAMTTHLCTLIILNH